MFFLFVFSRSAYVVDRRLLKQQTSVVSFLDRNYPSTSRHETYWCLDHIGDNAAAHIQS